MDYNNNNGHELGWDDEIQNEGKEYVLLPEGDYAFKVEKFERARHAGSAKIPPCNKAIVSFTVADAFGNNVIIEENLYLHTNMEWKLSEFFAAIGLKAKGEKARMDWGAVYGSTGVCRVYVEEFKRKDGTTGQKNRISKLYPSYDRPDIPQPAQAQSTYQQPQYQPPSYTQQQPTYTQPAQQGGWQPGNF